MWGFDYFVAKLKLDDHLYIDNFKKNLAVNFGIFDNPKTGQVR